MNNSALKTKGGKKFFLSKAFSAVVVITKDNNTSEYTATLLRPAPHQQRFAETHITQGVMSDKNFEKLINGAATPTKITSTRKNLAGAVISVNSINRFKNTAPVKGHTATSMEEAVSKLFEDVVDLPSNVAIQFKEGDTTSYLNVQSDGAVTEQITTVTNTPEGRTAKLLQTTEIHEYNAWKKSKKPALKPIRT